MTALRNLQRQLADIIPGARLEPTVLPGCPEICLYLLNADYPQEALAASTVQRVMDNPLYWTFCWASGQVLAAHLLRHPERVADRRVLDFGCGSGVVSIAAALAGAGEVIACDHDPFALAVTERNAALNGVRVQLASDFDSLAGPIELITAADVLYDRENLPWLTRFLRRADEVLVADSRLKSFNYPAYSEIARQVSLTVPDLDESSEFREVRVYLSH
jgi:predicted nicotinamide N-methyase